MARNAALGTPAEEDAAGQRQVIMEYPAIYRNEQDGIEAHVTKGAHGYHVALKDVDADEFVGVVFIYPNAERAHEKAREIVSQV